jgi:hypothetical protein
MWLCDIFWIKRKFQHYMPMSRAGHEKDRVLKVHTNFLSRNGVVDIIPELEQWPEIEDESRQQSFIQDPNLLQKEPHLLYTPNLSPIFSA